jgi:hypothetical protein
MFAETGAEDFNGVLKFASKSGEGGTTGERDSLSLPRSMRGEGGV